MEKTLRKLTLQDIQFFRTWLLDKNAVGYSRSYASMVYGMLKKFSNLP
ncbi:hypothetical protein X847_1399 [Listeria monocytogenes Lm_1889]|nr:hypothetical protein X844_1727 [Listeria monocytogenes Lm_1823]EXL23586.1 hypothetical protein X847_1399 [Listeria monocytogenes Lm_1889]